MLKLLRDFWAPAVMALATAGMVAVFLWLLTTPHISWNDKSNIGQYFKGFITTITFVVFFVSLWIQVRDVPKQLESLGQTRQDMERQTRYLREQAALAQEQLNQLRLQEVLANIRLLADNVEVTPDPATGAPVERWKSSAITELAQASLLLLRRHSVPALHSLRHSERAILQAFADTTLAAAKKNLRGAELQGAHLVGMRLDDAFLIDANLRECDLRNADLSGSNLLHAQLVEANLDGANLTGAHLMEADLARANLLGANLTEANLRDANLEQAVLAGADLTRAYIDQRWRTMVEGSGARNVDTVRWTPIPSLLPSAPPARGFLGWPGAAAHDPRRKTR
jgi:uncharacterized protein YjbI with pentapeptide repeats